MGDGGVACAPYQHIMERFPIPESLCGGNGVLTSKSFRSEKKLRHYDKGDQLERKADSGVLEKSSKMDMQAKRGKLDIALERQQGRKGELEEGELLNGELERGELQNGETENMELTSKKWWKSEAEVLDKSRKEEVEKGEFIPDKWSKGRLERGEYVQDKGNRQAELNKSDDRLARGRKADLEKVDFIPAKWRRNARENSPEGNQRRSGDASRVNPDFKRRSSSSKWDGSVHERDSKKGSRPSEIEPGEIRHEDTNGKGFDTDSNPGSLAKWQSVESESSNRKHHSDLSDPLGPRARRKSEENIQSSHSERSYRHIIPPSKVSSVTRLSSSRSNDPSLPSRGYHDRQGRTPCSLERTPKERTHHRDHRDRSPRHLDRSPRDRTRHSDRDRTQSRANRSAREKVRNLDHRDRTPRNLERSPHNRGHATDPRESTKRSRSAEKLQQNRFEDRSEGRESTEKDNAKNRSHMSICEDRSVDHKLKKEKLLQSSSRQSCEPPPPPPPPLLPPPPPVLPPPPPPPLPQCDGVSEEPPSMEEDMDISDTPPHDMLTSNSDGGKWFYLDEFGEERGPSKLVDLKRLVEDGFLPSDHIIKHADGDRWVTIENGVSPLVHLNFPSLVSDAVTQMVSPPEAPGNLLVDAGDLCEELASSTCTQQALFLDDSVPVKDYHIDKRVEALMDGCIIVDGMELEAIGEVLNTVFEHADWENWGQTEGFTRFQVKPIVQSKNQEAVSFEDYCPKEPCEIGVDAANEKDYAVTGGRFNDYLAGRWPCKGGDWKRIDEVVHDRSYRRKLVLNEGFPLSQMQKSGLEDPRWHRKDEGYHPSHSRKLDLPLWAFSFTEDSNDSTNDPSKSAVSGKSGQIKLLPPKGGKGTILPVVRINACVMKDQGSPETRIKVRGTDRHTPRCTRLNSIGDRFEGSSCSKKLHDNELHDMQHSDSVLNASKDHVCTVDELSINRGDWYYLDGAGYEHGPASYLELQELVAKGAILEHSSVFRKNDNTWLPVAKCSMLFEAIHTEEASSASVEGSSSAANQSALSPDNINSTSFHISHPQFLGYTRGKLHELVMKSYKNRELAAAINEVLDPWIAAKQLKKEMEKNFPFNSAVTKSSAVLAHKLPGDNLWRPEDGLYHAAKRARLLGDESDLDSEMEEDVLYNEKNEISFEELCIEVDTFEDNVSNSLREDESWGLLHGRVLARVFHFLKGDMKSLVHSASTCKHWNSAVKFYKNICSHLDLSSIGPKCNNPIFQIIMGGFRKELKSLILTGCSNISISVLEQVLQLFPCISYIDITGCNQLKELRGKFPNIRWINRLNSRRSKSTEESHSKIRSLKQINDISYVPRTSRGLSTYLDDSEGLDSFGNQSNWVKKIDFSNMQLQQGYYKRAKLLDARKSSQLLSRDAQMRGWMDRKTENSYRKMEVYIANSLKGIMKGTKFDFFIPKVAQIENRLRSGYYRRHGLSSAKTDICRMCRDALKAKGHCDSGDMKKILISFIQLAKRLEDNPSGTSERDETLRFSKDSSDSSSCISASNHKKRQSKFLSEKKGINRSNTSYSNGGTAHRAYASDREIRRSLSRLKKRDMDSDSETSEDHENDFSEEECESSASDIESDLEVHSRSEAWDFKGDESFKIEDSLESVIDDREWGARMTKASLVPPVTRKYEVIDRYIIVADEEEVRKKMRVSLPEDYSEKLLAQKSGTEDMDIPEVKEYKPRKVAGVEVLEQEVYGIDPYTYNLILDSMPDELEWPPADKHKFIEELILRTLNEQVRNFTGSGNTPMMYPLQPVIEEIQKNAEEGCDKRLVKMCHYILKAIRSRPDDNYVAYRKGLGVVCSKEKGFMEDDFVVEFLGEVYPAWKWYEKQDGIRSLQKNSQDPLPEFYNINLERPKGDRYGYDLVIVDAMHKANFASRICHSCRPNCEAKVTAVDGQYLIGIYTLRPISYGEEITFDYNSVTESKEEHEASVCLCGSQVCKGNYLSYVGEGAFLKVLKESHGVLDRHKLMLEACEANYVSKDDYLVLMGAGLGNCLLGGLPNWLVSYSAHLVRFINFERTKLPDEILRHNLEEKRKFTPDICLEVEKSDAEIQAEGVYNARLQQIAITLDKVRYVMKCIFGDPTKAPPLVEKLTGEGLVAALWKGDGSLVEDLLLSMAPHVEVNLLSDLKSKIRAHDPSGSDDIQKELSKSLLWLRDELRNLPSTNKYRHDAAADVIHMYAYTKLFFKIHVYNTLKSYPVYISPLDLGPKYAEKMGSGFQEYCKVYGENYCLGQLIYWYCQTNIDPDCRLARARKGCLLLPDITSFYSKSHEPLREHVYGSRTLRFMLSRMEKQPQRPWPKDRIWGFKSNPTFFGSPMLDSVINKCPLDKEMMHWLKTRPSVS